MVFSSPLFLFLFLPLFLLVYYPLPRRIKLGWILTGSWLFYALWRVDFLLLLIGVSLLNYISGILIVRARREGSPPGRDRLVLMLSTMFNLSILAYFKYANFGVEAFNQLLAVFGAGAMGHASVILPVGISFYIFQAMSYSIDVYRRDAPPAENFIELAAYIALFPQLIAGPIVRYKDLSDQLLEPHLAPGRMARGIRRFMFGFAKKVLIADGVAALVDGAFSLQVPHLLDAWIGVTAYAVQLYLDFAAYSDMAIGLGLMLGFRFRENFRQPYHSLTITEFWQRWHISLSTWLRDYLYIPLGGNRISRSRTYLNLFLVMALGGLWHGAAWTFLIWGMWHGILLLLERIDMKGMNLTGRILSYPAGRLFMRARTLLLVLMGWALFRADNLPAALRMIGGMFGLNGGGAVSADFRWQLQPSGIGILVLGILFAVLEPWIPRLFASSPLRRKPGSSHFRLLSSRIFSAAVATLLFALALVKLMAASYSPFLYFQF